MKIKNSLPSPKLPNLLSITKILTTESLREPTSIIWAALAPCVMFTLLSQAGIGAFNATSTYTHTAAWFYSYISANIALFGFSFYLIGRRESGFVRSFIFQRKAINTFLLAHTFSYLLIALLYLTIFYLTTKPFYSSYSLTEFIHIGASFYSSYLMFSCIGLLVAALPITFSTASTLFSITSFLMLFSGYLGAAQPNHSIQALALYNPLNFSKQIFTEELPLSISLLTSATFFLTCLLITARHFRIQPVWSRY